MNFPINSEKYASVPIFSPLDFLKYMQKEKVDSSLPLPDAVVLCYQGSVLAHARSRYKMLKPRILPGQLHLPECFDGELGIINIPGCGAPVSVIFLEQMIAAGIKKFISFGTAGSLQPDLDFGDIVLCDKAIRDEGTSWHYLPPDRYSYSAAGILQAIEMEFAAKFLSFRKGTCWTTDAPFLETETEVRNYQKEGVLAVDMEAAALFAVAEYRKVEVGSFFVISDKLAEAHWVPCFFNEKVISALDTALEIAFSILLNY